MTGMGALSERIKRHRFLFEELVKRDFKKKYKRTVLGVLWSVLAPLLNVLVLMLVFVNFFGREQEHFIIYIFCGTMVMSFYTETTQGCMRALMANAAIFTKINVPKSLFLLSKAFQTFINFLLTFAVFLAFCVGDGIPFGWHMLSLIYPSFWLLVMSFGVGMILSAMFVFFRDVEYLYGIFLTLLGYVSAIFYPTTMLPAQWRFLFYANPVYVYIDYFRTVTIGGTMPSTLVHLLCAVYALAFLGIGCLIYKKCNHEFLYYV